MDKICKKVEEEALNGNMQAAKMILERFLSPRKDRFIEIDFPPIHTFEDIVKVVKFIFSSVGKGEISPSEGEMLTRMVESYSKAMEACQFESRLKNLEENLKNRGKT